MKSLFPQIVTYLLNILAQDAIKQVADLLCPSPSLPLPPLSASCLNNQCWLTSACPGIQVSMRSYNIRPSIRLSVRLSVRPSVRSFLRPPIRSFVGPPVRLSVFLVVHQFTRPFICPAVHSKKSPAALLRI